MITIRGVKKNTSTWVSTYVFKCQHQLVLGLLLRRFCPVWLCTTPWTAATRLLCPWDSLGKNTGAGCHALLQGIPLNPGIESVCITGRFFTTEPPRKPPVSPRNHNTTPGGDMIAAKLPRNQEKKLFRLWYLISILLCLILLLTAAYHLLKILLPPYCPGLWTQTRKGPEPFFSVQETEPLTVAHRSQMLSLGAQHRLSVIFSNYCPFNLIPYYKTEVIMCTHGWFMSMYGNNHHNIVNKLSSN